MENFYPLFVSQIPAALLGQLSLLVAAVLLAFSAWILVRMQVNKRKEQRRQQVRQQWKDLLAEMLMTESLPEESLLLPAGFDAALRQPFVRRVLASELVRTQASLRGYMSETVVQVYNQLKLHSDSMRLLNSPKWHRKAKGIQQLSSMAQYQVAEIIVQHTNHRHPSVQGEAQVGMVRLEGPAGLRFLNQLQQPLSEWQQFNLLHELQLHGATSLPDLEQWLQAADPSVVVFAIRLCRLYQMYQHAPDLGKLTRHAQSQIRLEASQCLEHWEMGIDTLLIDAAADPLLQPMTA